MKLPSLLIASSLLLLAGATATAQTTPVPAEPAIPKFGPGPAPGVTPGYPAPAASAPAASAPAKASSAPKAP